MHDIIARVKSAIIRAHYRYLDIILSNNIYIYLLCDCINSKYLLQSTAVTKHSFVGEFLLGYGYEACQSILAGGFL